MHDHEHELALLLSESLNKKSLVKAVFSVPRTNETQFIRVTVRPVELRGTQLLQFSSQSMTQEFHKNWTFEEASSELIRLASMDFKNSFVATTSATIEARYSKKGKCFLRKTTTRQLASQNESKSHNRARNHLIPDGIPCPFLIETGVMSKSGNVLASQSRKFRQINRFLEIIHDVARLLPQDRTIHVVDFGCGKSYLTFATQYLLTTILKRDCQIVGLDRRADVVETCSKVVEVLGLTNLHFSVGDIADYVSSANVDMVISLHACDTATDEAIIQAIRWNSQVILAVPCCQHELNNHLTTNALTPLTSFGIAKERFAALSTDTMRASLLATAGYQTQLLEFIDTEHTPKNLLIRGVRKQDSESLKPETNNEVGRMRSMLGVPPLTLERRLMELGILKCFDKQQGSSGS